MSIIKIIFDLDLKKEKKKLNIKNCLNDQICLALNQLSYPQILTQRVKFVRCSNYD